jgi:putative transcriptional regulator
LNDNETKQKEVSLMVNQMQKYREEKGLTQADLAELLKISENYLGKIERGKSIPSMKLAVRIAKLLNCKLDDIFFY